MPLEVLDKLPINTSKHGKALTGLEDPEDNENGNHQTLQHTSTRVASLERSGVFLFAEGAFLDIGTGVLEDAVDGENPSSNAEREVEDEHAEEHPDKHELAPDSANQTEDGDEAEEDIHHDLDDQGLLGTRCIGYHWVDR